MTQRFAFNTSTRFLVALLVFSALHQLSFAQPERAGNHPLVFALSAKGKQNESDQNVYRILYELSVPLSKNPTREAIRYEFTFSIAPATTDHDTLEAVLRLVSVDQLKQYQDFDVGWFLIPSDAEVSITTTNKSYTISASFTDSTATIKLPFTVGNAENAPQLTIHSLNFSDEKVDKFLNALMMIRDYEACATIASILLKQASEPDDEFWSGFMAIIWYKHASDVLSNLEIWQARGLEGQDPKLAGETTKSLSVESYRRQLAFTRKYLNHDNKPDTASLASIDWIGLQIENLLNSDANRHPYNTPLVLRTTSISNQWMLQQHELISTLLSADDQLISKQRMNDNLKLVVDNLHNRANKRIESTNYSEALPFAETALTLSNLSNNQILAEKSHQLISRIHHGILEAWLTISKRALQVGNLSLSKQYIKKASDYQDQNRQFILSAEALNHAIELYSDSSLNTAIKQHNLQHHQKALQLLDDAQPLVLKLPYYSRRNQFLITHSQICTRIYENTLNHAVELLDKGIRDTGRLELKKAIDFRKTRNQLVDQREEEKIGSKLLILFEADSLLATVSSSAPADDELLDEVLERAALMIDSTPPVRSDTVRWKLFRLALKTASQSTESIEKLRKQFEYEAALKKQQQQHRRLKLYISLADSIHYQNLGEALIRNQQTGCSVANEWIDALTRAAYDAALTKHFVQAHQLVTKARYLTQQQPACQIDTSEIDALTKRYQEVWRFEKRMAKIDTLLARKMTSEAVAWFDLCYSDYQLNFLKLADMPAPRLENYLTKHPLEQLIDTILFRKFIKPEANDLIAIFEQIRKLGLSNNNILRWLPEFGSALAADHLTSHNDENLYLKIFKNDKNWYKGASNRFVEETGKNWFHKKMMQIKIML